MEELVGSTGFVGGNFAKQHHFDHTYHSTDIENSYGTKPDLLVYAGVRAEKFMANAHPDEDLASIKDAIHNIEMINPKRLVLISTIDVYPEPRNVDEDSFIDPEKVEPYGKHRLYLENWVRSNISNSSIIRLPALFGPGLKKNFVSDLINLIPTMLSDSKYQELSDQSILIKDSYDKQDNGFYKLKAQDEGPLSKLQKTFQQLNFTSLNFTDSRTVFAYYNMEQIWHHTQIILENNIPLINMAVEPISANELYQEVTGNQFNNIIRDEPLIYDFQTKYDEVLGGENGYIIDKATVLSDLVKFIRKNKKW